MDRREEPALTISEAAAFAGITVRAVRHYHQRGLLPEPPRDESGYRRYGADAVVALIRIRSLAEAGVPLARVRELLQAEPDEFADAVGEIDADLRERVRALEERRAAISQLATADGLGLPQGFVQYLAKLRAVGLSERIVKVERDGWLLVAARTPVEVLEAAVAEKMAALDDPGYARLYRTFDDAYDWKPGDPRLEQLADDLLAYAEEYLSENGRNDARRARLDDTVAALLDAQATSTSPGWRHLNQLITRRSRAADPI